MTQGLTAKQAGVATWEKGALAAGIFQAGVLVAQKNSLGMFPGARQSEGWCGVLKGLSLGHPWGLIVMGRGSCQASGYPGGLTPMFAGPTGREENEGPFGSTGCKIHTFKCRGTARVCELHSSAFESRLGSFLLPLENIWILHLGFGAGYDSVWTCLSHLPWFHGFPDPAVAPGSVSSECSPSNLPCHLRFRVPSHLCPQPQGHCHGGGFITMGGVLWPSLTSPTWERTGYLSLYGLYQREHNSHESDSSACGFVSLSATFTARSRLHTPGQVWRTHPPGSPGE